MSQQPPEQSNLTSPANAPRKKVVQGEKLRGADKVARIPVKVIPTTDLPRKPDWIRVRVPANGEVQRIKSLLQNILVFNDYWLHEVTLPEKLLATRSGLAKYGKNNITYVEGMGSFVALRVFVSDMPPGRSEWSEPQVMKACNRCKACLNECPTGAIVADRFLVHAERCLTFFNEGSEEFPGWINRSWHNSLVGCMKCQLVCPVNKLFFNWVEDGEDFDETETRLILDKVGAERLPRETVHKLNRMFNVDVKLKKPKVPYRETVLKRVERWGK